MKRYLMMAASVSLALGLAAPAIAASGSSGSGGEGRTSVGTPSKDPSTTTNGSPYQQSGQAMNGYSATTQSPRTQSGATPSEAPTVHPLTSADHGPSLGGGNGGNSGSNAK